jgi:MFS family permease
MTAANRLLWGFIGLSIVSGLAGGMMQLLLPLYALSLSISAAGVGVIRGVAQFGGLLTSLPGGFLIDHYGARRVYLVSSLLDAAMICLIPSISALPLLTSCLFLESSLGTLRWTTVNSAFFSHLDSFGHTKAGWTRASLGIGANFIGPLVGGGLAQMVSFRSSYAVVAGIVAAPALMLPFCGERRTARRETRTMEPLCSQFRGVLTNRLLWRVALLQAVSISSNSAFLVYIILLVVHELGGTSAFASQLIAAQGAAFVAVMLLGGRLLARHPLQNLYAASFAMQIAGLLTAGLTAQRELLLAGAVVFGLGSGMLTTINFSRLGAMPGPKGRLSGLFFLVTGTGVALGPLWGGLLTQFWSIRAVFLGFVPLAAVSFLYIVTQQPERNVPGSGPVALS